MTQFKAGDEKQADLLVKRIQIARNNSDEFVNAEKIADYPLRQKFYMILINPAGGKGKAEELTDKNAIPIFSEAGFGYEKLVTKHQERHEQLSYRSREQFCS